MITNLTIQNVQSIRKLSAELGPITVFHGESDQGKSAIVRALRGLAFNDWPKDFVTTGEQNASVAVTLDHGLIVAVRKGATANSYGMRGGADEAGVDKFDRVGRSVPEQVVEALGWSELELDDGTKIRPSFGTQFDGPFLLGDTPSRIAKVLGGLTNIHRLYAAIRSGANMERSARRSGEEAQSRVAEHQETVERLRGELEASEGLSKQFAYFLTTAQPKRDAILRLEALSGVVQEARATQIEKNEAVVFWAKKADALPELLLPFAELDGARRVGVEYRKALTLSEIATAEREVAAAKVAAVPEVGDQLARLAGLGSALVTARAAQAVAETATRVRHLATVDVAELTEKVEAFKVETGVCPACDRSWE